MIFSCWKMRWKFDDFSISETLGWIFSDEIVDPSFFGQCESLGNYIRSRWSEDLYLGDKIRVQFDHFIIFFLFGRDSNRTDVFLSL